jgi:hypothetical protein
VGGQQIVYLASSSAWGEGFKAGRSGYGLARWGSRTLARSRGVVPPACPAATFIAALRSALQWTIPLCSYLTREVSVLTAYEYSIPRNQSVLVGARCHAVSPLGSLGGHAASEALQFPKSFTHYLSLNGEHVNVRSCAA